MRTLGDNIKKAREKSHKTQDELASSLSVSLSTVWRWEKGERTPTMGNLWRIAMELSIPMSELLEGVDEKDIPSTPDTYYDERNELQKIFSEEDLKTYKNQVKELIQKIPYMEDPNGFFEIENIFIHELNEAKRETYKRAEFHPPEHETYLKPEKHEKYGGIIDRVYPAEKLLPHLQDKTDSQHDESNLTSGSKSREEESTDQTEGAEGFSHAEGFIVSPSRSDTDKRLFRVSNREKTVEVEISVNDPPEFIKLVIESVNNIVDRDNSAKTSSGTAFKPVVGGDTSS